MSKISPKVKKLYYSIGEVSEMTDLKSYVLRYWETEFSQLKPPKNRAGNRTYRQKDIEVILNIKDLLYKKKFTIDGARVVLNEKDKIGSKPNDPNVLSNNQKVVLSNIKKSLKEILNIITEGLDAENKVKITGFGTFKKLNKKSRMGRNPKTGKVYEIKARNTVSFYPSKKTKNLING